MVTEEDADGLERFLEAHPSDIADRPIKQAVERIRTSAAVISRDGKAVEEFLAGLENADERSDPVSL
jgi:hypothetical protein